VEIDFTGKVAFVTGGASGIGRAAAIEFSKAGAKVMVADVDRAGGERTVAIIHDLRGEASYVKCDTSIENDVRDAIALTIQKYKRLDCAFNNAGIEGGQAPTGECDTANFDRVISVNLKGVWLCMKYEIPHLLASGEGAIVNCSSIAGIIGFPGIPAYDAAKHGVLGLTRTAALEYAKNGLRINAVCPGVIETPMIERFVKGDDKAREQLLAGEPVGRAGRPEEIADAVLWLCSNKASFVTGHALVADGGWTAQ
jgi:NAD(P)-dependent dehydrogenase (short-subunit alcohol dehydrogenase family)